MTMIKNLTGSFPQVLQGTITLVDTPLSGYQITNVGGNKVSGTATNLVNDVPAAAGYQIVNVGGAKVGGDPTGLTNDPTSYTASISIDGTPRAVAVTGSAAQTFTLLIDEINADISTWGTASLSGGNIKITSLATGVSSTVAITDTDLFGTLTGYVAILAAVGGTNIVVTTYTATVLVDGTTTRNISIAGGNAQTFGTLLSELNTDLSTFATATFSGGNIKITSTTTGVSSAVAITPGTLFASPLNGFVAVLAAVAGNVGDPGVFSVGETVTGSNFSAKVVKYSAATQKLTVKKIVGNPATDLVLTGGTSTASGKVATITQSAVGGVAVNTGGWNLRETAHGITKSKVVGARTMVEVMLADRGLLASRTDVATIPTFSLTAITSTGVLDISEADQFTFTITASEQVMVTGAPTFAFTIGATGKTATFISQTPTVLTFGYTVVGGDESADADFTVAAGNFGLTGAAIYDVTSGGRVAMTAPVAVSGTSLTQIDQVIVA